MLGMAFRTFLLPLVSVGAIDKLNFQHSGIIILQDQ